MSIIYVLNLLTVLNLESLLCLSSMPIRETKTIVPVEFVGIHHDANNIGSNGTRG